MMVTACLTFVLFCVSCLMPATPDDDNILVTYEMDTVGAVEAVHSITEVLPDSCITDVKETHIIKDTLLSPPPTILWKQTYQPALIVDFAITLLGTPYRYASADPAVGFDCSGFITYVFNHFGLKVPRSSVEFTNRGTEVPVMQARPGDLILFTGTDSSVHTVGHMGIVTTNSNGKLQFIHSSSGKAHGVTISPLQGYYESRFVKVISVKEGM